MDVEIEAKFLNLDHDEIRAKLTSIGAKLEQPMRLMRRVILDYPDMRLNKDKFGRLRVRDEGDKITLNFKSGTDKEYSKEIETTTGSYEKTVDILKAAGLQTYSFQESKRETWKYNGVEVVLDEWPWLKTYIEIEGPSEQSIKDCAKDLSLDWDNAFFGNVDTAYRYQYKGMSADDTIGVIPEVRFDAKLPDWLRKRQKL